jgi:hypothetical protein
MVDSDGNDQIGSEAHVTGTLIHKTDTAITLLVTSKVGTATVSSWFVSYRGQRIDHDPATGKCLGTLLEEGRTNLLSRSDGFNDTGAWGRANVSITQDENISTPTNTAAFKLVENASTGAKYINRVALTSVSTGTTYTVSCFAKAAERTFLLLTGDTSAGAMPTACFDLNNGSVSIVQAGGTASIQSFGGGWYRCIVSSTSTSTSVRFGIGMRLNSGTTFPSYIGDGVSGLYVFGAQLEAGIGASSYIPTALGGSVVRSVDVYSITATAFNRMWDASKGTFFVSTTRLQPTGQTYSAIMSASDGTNNNRIFIGNEGNPNDIGFNINRLGLTEYGGNINNGGFVRRAALAYSQNSANRSYNGVNGIEDTSVLIPTVTQMVFGAGQVLPSVLYYRDRLPNAQLQALTTIISDTIVYNGVAIWYNGEGLIETS